jgi:glycine betaine catabolism B
MLQPWQEATIKKVEVVNSNTNIYTIELSQLEVFDFVPGQFVTFDLPIHEKPNKRLRSYSIASAPNHTNIIELIIVLANPSTGGSAYIFNNFKPETKVTLRGPTGVFTLPKEGIEDAALFFICTGTGIAPFRSMLQNMQKVNVFPKQTHMVFGGRQEQDLLYRAEMESLAKDLNSFNYQPTLSATFFLYMRLEKYD